jgi:hypothetical protein
MLLQEFIDIKVNSTSLKHYRDKGYDVNINNIITVKTEDLTKSSFYEVRVKCDYCDKEKRIKYYHYLKNIKNNGIYCCSNKCAHQLKNKKTNIRKFGVDSFSKTNEYKERFKNTCINKYGVDNPSKRIEIKKKISNKKIDYWKNKLIKELGVLSIKNNTYELKCDCEKNHNYFIDKDILHNRKQLKTVLCTICHPIKSYFNSGQEIKLKEFLSDYVKVLNNDRHLGKELDIYIPELKLAFEFNGLYWHNELNKPNKYHLDKTELCEEKGIQLIHIYEDDWIYKQDIVKSMILNKLGKTPNKIYARKCEIREILDNKLVREFLNNNHIQGFIGSKIKIGLFYENELVSLMTFGKRRISMGKKSSEEGEYELLRFCSKLNTNVVGGANKLFKYFKENYNPKFITTYADRSWSTGGLYYQLGLKFKGKTQPNYYYIIDGVRHHRFGFRKDVLVKEGYDANKTEHDIMLDRGIYRIYDSGNLKFEFI